MSPGFRRLIAIGAIAVLALPTSVASAATPQSSCSATPLTLPASAPPGARSRVTKADDTGRYVVGEVDMGEFDFRPVLWSAGVPQLLDSAPGANASVVDVNSSGAVLGLSEDKEGAWQPWVYADGAYKLLELPDYLSGTTAAAINNRGDVVGSGMSQFTEDFASLVWPAGGKPRVLLTEDDRFSQAFDLNDAGVVIGVTASDDNKQTGIRWESWDKHGVLVYGRDKNRSGLKEIRGRWTGGSEIFDNPPTFAGMLWTDLGTAVYPLPGEPASLNSSGDAVTFDENGGDVVVTPGGYVRWRFPVPTTIRTLMDRRGTAIDAVGEVNDNGTTRAVTWSGCSPVLED